MVNENVVKILVDFGTIADPRSISGIWTFDTDTFDLYHNGSVKNNVAKDYDQLQLSDVGALVATQPSQGRFLAGATAYTVYDSATRIGVFTSDEAATSGRGYIITPKIPSTNIRNWWREFFLKFRRLDTSTDRLRVLYRIQESNTLPAYETITWVTATTFTGTNADVAVGDFVEILAGDNAGAIAKITVITAGSPNTYTIDLTLSASTSAARARYLNFIDSATISSQAIQEQVFRTARRSNWIQFLVELRGSETSPQLEEMIIDQDDLPL